jgi:hypothetical protein
VLRPYGIAAHRKGRLALNTEFEFTLPLGYVDVPGSADVHRQGRMRLATALDEIESVAHTRVQENDAYLPIVLLSRVITQLGSLSQITPTVVERLFAADLAYLEDLYLQLNSYEGMVVRAVCPHCNSEMHLKIAPPQDAERTTVEG